MEAAASRDIAYDYLLEDAVAEIVHDLKSPLSAISLETMLVEDRLARGDRSGSERSLARIANNVSFLDRIVLDLLDVCACAKGDMTLARERTDLRELIRNVIDRLAETSAHGRVFLDANESVIVMIDPHRIERVVANLLDNALKYTPSDAGVVVRLTPYGGGACVSVIDAGPGIDASDLPRIFRRNERGHTSRGRSGNGLGLYVSKRIIEAHGGQIGVESIRGVGSRFFFELPA